MAGGLPPPPTKAADGSYAWLDWYRKLQSYVSQSGSIPWNVINFAGSDLSNIQTRTHESLQSIQGGGTGEHYHLTLAQWSALTAGPHNNLSGLQGGTTNQYYHLTAAEYGNLQNGRAPFTAQASDPTTAQIPAGSFAMYKNTTSGLLKLWANDGGTMKSVTLS